MEKDKVDHGNNGKKGWWNVAIMRRKTHVVVQEQGWVEEGKQQAEWMEGIKRSEPNIGRNDVPSTTLLVARVDAPPLCC